MGLLARTRSDSKDSLLLPTEMGVGAARNANSEAAVAAVEWEESGDESREKRRVSRSEFPDGSWKWSKILSINLQASNSYAFCSQS